MSFLYMTIWIPRLVSLPEKEMNPNPSQLRI
jgi:hypothetical protein